MKSISEICELYDIRDYTINKDGSIDVDSGVYLYDNKLTKLPLKFGSVSGDFDCRNNDLTTLEFSPKTISGYFDCRNNKLTNLKGSPETIGSGFYCFNNPIGSISGEMDIDFIRAFNTFKVIKGNKVNLKRLKYVMSLFDKPINLNKIEKYYEIY